MPSEILKTLSPLSALYKSTLYKFIVDEESAHFTIKNIVEASGNVNPFADLASPPWGKGEDSKGATWAVHAVWEIEAEGRHHISGVIEQKPFYLSGHDVFRMDASGRVISHERGFDQTLASLASYFNPLQHVADDFNPLQHVPSLDSVLPSSLASKTES